MEEGRIHESQKQISNKPKKRSRGISPGVQWSLQPKQFNQSPITPMGDLLMVLPYSYQGYKQEPLCLQNQKRKKPLEQRVQTLL